jgi:hypothetical protein
VSVRWSREAIEALGPTTDVPTTAAMFGVDQETVYAAIRRGEWTATRVLRIGRKIRIPTLDLIRTLYEPGAGATPAVPSPCHGPVSQQVTATEPHTSCGCTPDVAGVIPLRKAT